MPATEIGALEDRRDHEIDYPREARIARREGAAKVGFVIDETGRVTDCGIVQSSGDTYLDTGSCALIVARGLFTPARDPQGRAIRSGQVRDIAWSLDWDRVQPLAERIVRLSYTIHEDGSFADCWLDRGEGTAGVSHPEMCVGVWPANVLDYLRLIAGPGDLHIQLISGTALGEETMNRQMAPIPGWVRYNGDAAWHLLDGSGSATGCIDVPFPGGTLWEDGPCRTTTRRYAVATDNSGQVAPNRIGLHFSWFVQQDTAANH